MNDFNSIKDLSISDLKAALDFIIDEAKDLEKKALEKNIMVTSIPAYNDYKTLEFKIHTELLNKTTSLLH